MMGDFVFVALRGAGCPHPVPPPRGREQSGGDSGGGWRIGIVAVRRCTFVMAIQGTKVENAAEKLPPPQGEARSGRVPIQNADAF